MSSSTFFVPKEKQFDEPPKSWKLEKDLVKPYQQWHHQRTPADMAAIIQSLDSDLASAVKRVNQGKVTPALKAKAKLMIAKKLPLYDPEKASMRTWVSSQLQALQRPAAQQFEPLRVPERTVLDAQLIDRTMKDFEAEEGREPSMVELADKLGFTARRIQKALNYRTPAAAGWYASLSDESEDADFSPAVVQTVNQKMLLSYMYDAASPMDQVILEHTFGLHGKPRLSTSDIAKKIRKSPGLVSQRRAALRDGMRRMEGMLL